jgi:hypothetical protein
MRKQRPGSVEGIPNPIPHVRGVERNHGSIRGDFKGVLL